MPDERSEPTEQPSRREADKALVELQADVADVATNVADLAGMHSKLHEQHEVTRDQVRLLNFAVFGIPDTDEKGLLGEVKSIGEKLDRLLIACAGLILTGLAIAISIALNN